MCAGDGGGWEPCGSCHFSHHLPCPLPTHSTSHFGVGGVVGKLLFVYQLPSTSFSSVSSGFPAHLSSLPLTNSFSFISSSSSFSTASIPVFIPGCEKGVLKCVCVHPCTLEHYSCRERKSVTLGIIFVFSYGLFPDNAPCFHSVFSFPPKAED